MHSTSKTPPGWFFIMCAIDTKWLPLASSRKYRTASFQTSLAFKFSVALTQRNMKPHRKPEGMGNRGRSRNLWFFFFFFFLGGGSKLSLNTLQKLFQQITSSPNSITLSNNPLPLLCIINNLMPVVVVPWTWISMVKDTPLEQPCLVLGYKCCTDIFNVKVQVLTTAPQTSCFWDRTWFFGSRRMNARLQQNELEAYTQL